MSKLDFTSADLETLLDGLDELERKDLEYLPSVEKLLKILPEPRREEHHAAYSEFRQDLIRQEGKMKKMKKMAREKITLLKAKIIMLQQAEATDKLFDDASKPCEDEEKS